MNIFTLPHYSRYQIESKINKTSVHTKTLESHLDDPKRIQRTNFLALLGKDITVL